MKKFLMLLAVAGFFSMTVVSCGGEEKAGDDQEQHDDHEGGDEHGEDGHEH